METNKSSLGKLLFQCLGIVLLIQMIPVPIVYLTIAHNIYMPDVLVMGVLRLILVVAVGRHFYKKNRELLSSNVEQKRKIFIVALVGVVVGGIVDSTDIGFGIYMFAIDLIRAATGIDLFADPMEHLFSAVLAEQLFTNYLMVNMFLFLAIVFFQPRSEYSAESGILSKRFREK